MTATDTHKPTLIIHGASSYTAKELLAYLESHPDGRSFEFLLAGRTKARLDKVNESLKTPREVVVVDLENDGSVKELIAKGDVVINLAGPFRWYNAEALIKECAATGKHYVDLTGEQAWLAKDIVSKYNYLASKTGACIVPSCGFDSVPSDISLYSALSTLQASHPDLSITKSTAMFKADGTFSGGTVASLFAEVELPDEYLTGQFRGEWCLTPTLLPSSTPKPIITLSHPRLPFPTKIGAFFVMFPFNSTIVRRSWYLSRLPDNQHQNPFNDPVGGGEEPKHGDNLVYEEGMDIGVNSKIVAGLVSFTLFGFFALFNYSNLFRKVVKYIAPQQGTGASPETLKKGKCKVTSLSLTTDPNIAVLTTYTGLGDPGYMHTCHLLAESALSLVLPPPAGTSLPPLSARGGCLTPSTAMGQVLIARMKNMGGSVKSELLIEGQESSKGRYVSKL